MVTSSFGFLAAYLLVGLVACVLARKGRPDDWDETILASVLGPPLIALIATAAAAGFVRDRLSAALDRRGSRA
jgi:biotin transporter BioY